MAPARDKLARLRDLTDGSERAVRVGLENMARELGRSPLSGRLAFVVRGDDDGAVALLDLDRAAVHEPDDLDSPPDLVVYTREQTLAEILAGALSPLQAMLDGRLRYGGDTALAIAILRELAATQDAVFEPCREADAR